MDFFTPFLQAIHSVAWHHEGKQFICSHSDGTLTIWNVRSPAKPVQTITPHGKNVPKLWWIINCFVYAFGFVFLFLYEEKDGSNLSELEIIKHTEKYVAVMY